MIPVSYYTPGELTSPTFAFSFAKGCGGCITDETVLFPGPVALFGSPSKWPVLRQAQAAGRDWFYGDHGYFGRKTFYRITRNAYQHDGSGEATPERWEKFGKPIQPWRKTGAHILICPNSDIHFELHGLNAKTWLDGVRATLRQHTDRELRVRWKRGQRTYITEDLRNAWAVVVYSSAAALDALIYGIPVFVLAPWAAGYRMGLSDLAHIESPALPDGRESFIWQLASQQWTLPEIYTGVAWRALQEQEVRCAA